MRVLTEGAVGGCAAGHVLELNAVEARKWADGVRAEYADEDIERAVQPVAETRLAVNNHARTRTRGGNRR